MKLLGCVSPALLLLLLLAHSVSTQLGPPVDQEGSADGFLDDEDLLSGSGSGLSDIEPETTKMGVSFTTSEPLPLSTTQATGQAPSAPPAAEPSSPPVPEMENESGMEMEREIELERKQENEREQQEIEQEREIEAEDEMQSVREKERQRKLERDREQELDREREREKELEREREMEQERERQRERARSTVAPRFHLVPAMTTDSSQTLSETAMATVNMEDLSTIEEDLDEDLYITTETYPTNSFSTDISTTEAPPTTVASTTAKTILNPTPSIAPPRRRKPHPTPSVAPHRPQKPQVVPSEATPTESITHPMTSTLQVRTTEASINNEVAAAGPSGDFEIQEDGGRQGNEVGQGKGVLDVGMEPDLTGNTIDSGSSAAQLPQKNILERKEVLIAVIVGGVVGALFAAFLVMLLVYRMKKKDEGSYTLEEPKQATVTYQKPDKQEEFYA
ncbi:syndecan-3 [Trichomycterus rosablanca]|uniref:syndecan-3 n=1 Tax=Trichomycterus rosablanca TaxID=2290929 RepID=UPI002F3546C8